MTITPETKILQKLFCDHMTGPEPVYVAIGKNAIERLEEIPGLSQEILELSEEQIRQCVEFIAISMVEPEDLKAFLELSSRESMSFDKAMDLVWESESIFDPNGFNPKDLELELLGAALVNASKSSEVNLRKMNRGFLMLVQGIGGILYTLYGRDRFIEITREWVKNNSSQSMLNYCRLFEGWDEVREYPIEWAIEILSKKAS